MILQAVSSAGAVYATASSIGLLHGFEPGHGWPVAAIYALSQRRRWLSGTAAGLIIALAHLVSARGALTNTGIPTRETATPRGTDVRRRKHPASLRQSTNHVRRAFGESPRSRSRWASLTRRNSRSLLCVQDEPTVGV